MLKKFNDAESYFLNAEAKYYLNDFEGAVASGKKALSLSKLKKEKIFCAVQH